MLHIYYNLLRFYCSCLPFFFFTLTRCRVFNVTRQIFQPYALFSNCMYCNLKSQLWFWAILRYIFCLKVKFIPMTENNPTSVSVLGILDTRSGFSLVHHIIPKSYSPTPRQDIKERCLLLPCPK